jgi:hypothetical protein
MILTPKLQMKDKSLNDNYKSKELVVHIEVDYEVQMKNLWSRNLKLVY